MFRPLSTLAVLAACVALPAGATAGNSSLIPLKIGDAVVVEGTHIACFAINSSNKNGIGCVLLLPSGKFVVGSYGVGLAVDGTAVVNRVDAKGNGKKIWKKRLPAARGASASQTYTVKVGEGFGISAGKNGILGCQVLNVTSTTVEPIYRGVKVSCWFATATKAVPNRYGISISEKFAGVFKTTPKGTLSTWGLVKQQP